ncbi:hypothetical protein Tco_1484152 [Tanacetum coccineum]
MDAPVISISSDTSKESVSSHAPRVILFGAIPAIIPVIPEDSLPPAPDLPLVLHFLCSDDTEADDESKPAEQRPLLTARKRVRPLPARRLAWRRVSHHSSDHHSSPDSTPRHSKAFRRWRFAPLSSPYPLTTSESSLCSSSERLLDSSSPSSRLSCKRCRSLTASIPSSTHISRSITPTPADLLPPRKRFRDSYTSDDSGEEHIEVDTADAEAVADVGISEGVVAHPEDGIGMRFEIAVSDVREDDEEFEAEVSAADTREIVVDPLVIGDSSGITEIETTQIQLETSQMVANGERASLVERIGSLRLEYLKVRAMLSIERDRIDSIHWHMALSQEEFRQVRRDRDDTRRRLRRLESYVERHLGFRP